jgi:hypothetical protein
LPDEVSYHAASALICCACAVLGIGWRVLRACLPGRLLWPVRDDRFQGYTGMALCEIVSHRGAEREIAEVFRLLCGGLCRYGPESRWFACFACRYMPTRSPAVAVLCDAGRNALSLGWMS